MSEDLLKSMKAAHIFLFLFIAYDSYSVFNINRLSSVRWSDFKSNLFIFQMSFVRKYMSIRLVKILMKSFPIQFDIIMPW